MSFTDQKPFTVTEQDIHATWSGVRVSKTATTHPVFRCAWCGHGFRVGDVARWVFTNVSGEETKGLAGNPFICSRCDGPRPEIPARLRAVLVEFNAPRFWWFRRHETENAFASGQQDGEQYAARHTDPGEEP